MCVRGFRAQRPGVLPEETDQETESSQRKAANSPQTSKCPCLSPKTSSQTTVLLFFFFLFSSSSSWLLFSLTSVADSTVVLVVVAAELKLPMIRLLMCFYASVCDDEAADTHTHFYMHTHTSGTE